MNKIILKSKIMNIIVAFNILFTLFSIDSNASNNIDITYRSIAKSIGGSNNDYFNSAIETVSKDIVYVGHSNSTDLGFTNKGGNDAIIARYKKDGTRLWIKSFGGSKADSFSSVIATDDDGVIAIGHSYSTDAGFSNKGNRDSIIIKYDKNGNQEWIQSFGGTSDDQFKTAISSSDGGFICVGYSYSNNIGFTNKGDYDAIIVKYNKNGNQEWIKSFGGSKTDYFSGISKTKDSGFIVSGYSNSSTNTLTNNGGSDAIIVKYDSTGNLEWERSIGGSKDECFNSVTETQNGSFIAVGYSFSTDLEFINSGNADMIIAKYDNNGNKGWVKSVGTSNTDSLESVIAIDNNNILAVGYNNNTSSNNSNAVILKYDTNGNQEFMDTFGKSDGNIFNSICIHNNGIVAVGNSRSNNFAVSNKGNIDALSVKYNNNCMINETVFDKVYNLHNFDSSTDSEDLLNEARILVNSINDSDLRDYLNDKLNNLNLGFGRKESTANADIFIKCKNTLSVSLNTNSVVFEDFDGVEDMEKLKAINLTVESTLPYELSAYLESEIQNKDKSSTLDMSILSIKESNQDVYKTFSNYKTPLKLLDNQVAGQSISHGIDLKLNKGVYYKTDVYKAVIKIEIRQK